MTRSPQPAAIPTQRARVVWSPRRRALELALRRSIARAAEQDRLLRLRSGDELPFVDLREVYCLRSRGR